MVRTCTAGIAAFSLLVTGCIGNGDMRGRDSGACSDGPLVPSEPVQIYDSRKGAWTWAIAEDVRDGEELLHRNCLYRARGDSLLTLGAARMDELLRADSPVAEAGETDRLSAASWVLLLGSEGKEAGHLRLGELESGERFAFNGRVHETFDRGGTKSVQETGEVLSRVTETYERTAPGVHQLRIRHLDGSEDTILGTEEHPFWVPAMERWVQLADLTAGTELQASGGSVAVVVEHPERRGQVDVFNLEVAGVHNYFVGGADGTGPSVLVHNATYRGRIQAQGTDLEVSRSWTREEPPSVSEGKAMLEEVRGELSKRDASIREDGFRKAERFIDAAGEAGGVSAPVSRSWKAKGTRSERVDIEVIEGEAFVPDP